MTIHEFENGYTACYYNGKLFISNQQVAKKLPYYQTEAYKMFVDPNGIFEFLVDEERANRIMEIVKGLPKHRE